MLNVYFFFQFNRSLSAEALRHVELSLAAGARPEKVRKQLSEKFGVNLKVKTLGNIKNKVIGKYNFHDKTEIF